MCYIGQIPLPLSKAMGVGQEGFVVASVQQVGLDGQAHTCTSPGRIPGTPRAPSMPDVPVRWAHIWCLLTCILFQELE